MSGLFAIFIGPLVGRASDAFGKFPTFTFGTVMSIVMVLIYTHLGEVTFDGRDPVNVLMFVGIFFRMIPSQALISAIPAARSTRLLQRGQRVAAAALRRARLGVCRRAYHARCGRFAGHFDRLGYVVVTTAVISLILMYFVQRPIAVQAGKRVV